MFGLARRPEATRLHLVVRELPRRIDVMQWDSVTAECYGTIRAAMALVLAPLDLLVATHALSLGAILVTNDRAFGRVQALPIEDWSVDQAP